MLVGIRAIKESNRQVGAFLCLGLACAIGSLDYSYEVFWLFTREVSYLPDLVSGIVALAVVRPVLAADLQHNHTVDWATWINFGLLFYLTAIFANIGLGGDISILKSPSSFVALLVVGMANLNARRYGEILVPILLLFGALNISIANKAMGLAGFFLVFFALIGTVLLIDFVKVKDRVFPRPIN